MRVFGNITNDVELARVMLDTRLNDFRNYAITFDNVLKMFAIYFRVKSRIPVVIFVLQYLFILFFFWFLPTETLAARSPLPGPPSSLFYFFFFNYEIVVYVFFCTFFIFFFNERERS